MARPLTWNMAGLRWNQQGATWNGTVANRRAMNKTKAVIDFSGYTAADLAPVAQNVHDQMAAHAATFASPPVAMTALQTRIDDFNTKLAAKASRATADVLAFNLVRDELEGDLGLLGNYVNGVANGLASIVADSGFPSYVTGQTAPSGPPAPPTNLRLRHGDLPGQVVARYRPDRSPSMNEVEKCFGDPNNEENWEPVATFSGGKATITGLTPGVVVWIRVRTIGTGGTTGGWSGMESIRVM